MSLRSQSGMTLVELIIAMAITAVVLAALAGVVFGANLVSNSWGQRTYLAETAQLLPNALQADVHRYVPCGTGAELDLCLPAQAGGPVGPKMVTYTAGSGCPCDLVRVDSELGTRTLVVRGLEALPSFTASCAQSGGVDSGVIAVTLRYHGDAVAEPPLEVFFRAPYGGCP